MVPSAVLVRYARSLADVAFEEKIEDNVTQDLITINELFIAVPDVIKTFTSPAVPPGTKELILDELVTRYPVNKITHNFLRILLHNNRIGHFTAITDGFVKLVNERKGVLSARITAAVELSPEETKKIKERLEAITGKNVIVEIKTDHNLLGGMVVRVGSTVFDGSIRTQLAVMRRRLME
ncbi:MAG TPA: ATP synthase F1 subunit delta [Acidobacteriota bacterium]|nr:ATP synthase F1 subunit delta [Acidobacteriota bacterium]